MSPSMAYQQPCLNADGFGVGWYAQQGSVPCVFTSLKPAWNDPNLRNLSEEVRSPMIFAHIRAAGPSSSVNDACCHPFKAGRLLFAHNGLVGNFEKCRRQLLSRLNEYAFSVAIDHACIDSVVAFAIFLTELGVASEEEALAEQNGDSMCSALTRTIECLTEACASFGPEESLLNLMVTDGQRIVACRYGTAPSDGTSEEEQQPLGATLYLSVGSRWVASPDDTQSYRMKKGADIKCCTAILSSEPLTAVREEWLPIAPNSIVLCGRTRGNCHHIDTLMFPLKCGPAVGLSALRGVESAPQVRKDSGDETLAPIEGQSAESAVQKEASSLLEQDSWMSITGHSEDVNCLAAISDAVLAAGSMDGSLRFFAAEEAKPLAVRRHSEASGPILALLFISKQTTASTSGSSNPADGDISPVSLASPADSLAATPRSPDVYDTWAARSASPPIRSRQVASPKCPPTEERRRSSGEIVLTGIELPEVYRRLAFQVPKQAAQTDVLLSTSINELRVWDVSALCKDSHEDDQVEIPCIFCFHFFPNLGHILSLGGNLSSVFLGCQSTQLLRLRLLEGWGPLLRAKLKTKTTRHFTFNVHLAKSNKCTQSGSSPKSTRAKFCHHSLLDVMQTCKMGHMGFVYCVAHEPHSGMVASGGGDGRILFWNERTQEAISMFNHGGPVFALTACSFSRGIYSGDAYGRVRVWDCSAVRHGSRAVLVAGGASSPAILTLATTGERSLAAGEQPVLLLSGDAAGTLRIWDAERNYLLREVSASMTCCAACCFFGPGLTQAAGPAEHWLLRLAVGGDSSGAVRLAYLSVGACADPSGRSEESHRDADFQHLVKLLTEFVAIPTVSSDARHEQDMRRGCAWLAQKYEELLGATVRIMNGCVIARCGWEANKPLVIMYSHYDVVALGRGWSTDPWQVVAKDGYFYGRGVSDNKGALLAQIFAVRRLLKKSSATELDEFVLHGFDLDDSSREIGSGGCPVNVLFLADGREEAGDPKEIVRVVREARQDGWLRGDAVGLIVNNSQWIDDERPCICYGMRGVLDLEIAVQGGERDLHSGTAGGLSPEPMFDLMSLVSSLTDATGTPTVPGLLDDVQQPSQEDWNYLEAAAKQMSAEKLRKRLGLGSEATGPGWLSSQAPGLEALKRTWLQPSLSITEVGKGPRNSHGRHIANRASCVVSVRTTPGQRHEHIVACLKKHLMHEFARRRSPNRLEISTLAACNPWQAQTQSQVYRSARAAVAKAWGIEEAAVLQVREGGTMAMLPLLEAELGCVAVQFAFSQASDAVHLPNERISRAVLSSAIEIIAETLSRLGVSETSN
eukprot:TRINITY_DN60676_c0_g1_i1.p1 TRINITY_DN60676_c0_g1~~TRINITY_DN60676_c0_g1_i1.p1  ORF type:complete len:1375 (+),score=221.29 TRINITY_DN60676_c0_g1_i1:183-4127(+)